MARLELDGVVKHYGRTEVIRGVDLTVEDGAFCVFVGPSGCGKSTLLRMIAGLEDITDGEALIDGERINERGPADRGLAMVFQTYALYPHKTVYGNMAFALRHAGVAKAVIDRQVRDAAAILGLDGLLERYPRQLSGGQRQRVAIGRAIVRNPRIFLFDEPLSNLDAALRVQMRVEILRLHQRLGTTMIYVTHDQVEAMTLADKIVVLNGGRIEQVGAPMQLYQHPANLFVARFIGSPTMNVLPVTPVGLEGGVARVRTAAGTAVEVPVAEAVTAENTQFGVRPEQLRVLDADVDGDGVFRGVAQVVERLGGETLLHVALGDDAIIVVKAAGGSAHRVGDPVVVAPEDGAGHLFDGTGRCVDRLMPAARA
ncbi:MAG: sn-glycerol-3-phosphate ABC transporter ATP-binding protein UgpC [Pseudomonadota bacterium]